MLGWNEHEVGDTPSSASQVYKLRVKKHYDINFHKDLKTKSTSTYYISVNRSFYAIFLFLETQNPISLK